MNKTGPGSWKITAAGHVASGEDPTIAVKREIFEELGINVNPIYLSKEFNKDDKHGESKFYWIYYAVVNGKQPLVLDKEEVMNAKWILPNELKEFARQNDWDVNGLSHRTIMEVKEKLGY